MIFSRVNKVADLAQGVRHKLTGAAPLRLDAPSAKC
jgi:hypothetical protein